MSPNLSKKKSAVSNRKLYLNPFFLFLAEFRKYLKKTGQNYKCIEESVLAGRQWRQMSASEKLNYVTWAKKNREIKKIEDSKQNKIKILKPPELLPFLSPSAAFSPSQEGFKSVNTKSNENTDRRGSGIYAVKKIPSSLPKIVKNKVGRPKKNPSLSITKKIANFQWYI